MQQPVASFSGGWRMRLNLAQALMCPSDLLLLDEPTNHLDLDAIIWLEDWLKRYPGTLIIISHDRDFLDEVVNVVAHIDERKLKRYSGNYSSFERQRAAQMILAAGALEKQQRKRAHLESFVNRFKAQASKARQAQSRMKALAKMEELAPLRAAAEFSFEFREPLSAPNPLLVMEDVDAGYKIENDATGEITHKTIVNGIKFSLQIGQRIGLLGQNGAGKSTLIKTIAGELSPLTGDATMGKGLNIGYFAQHQVEMLRHDESPLWHLAKIAPTVREQELRNFLGGFNFPGTMVTSSIRPFSGGEKARLALALIVWQRPNLLLLDEPTNHLDLDMRQALTEALIDFEGAMVVVSHDRHLLRSTTDDLYLVHGGKVEQFDGDLEDYQQWLVDISRQENQQDAPSKDGSVNSAQSRKDQKRREADFRNQTQPLRKQITKLETQMEKLTAELATLEERLADSAIYDISRKAELTECLQQQTKVKGALDDTEMTWLDAQEQLESLAKAFDLES